MIVCLGRICKYDLSIYLHIFDLNFAIKKFKKSVDIWIKLLYNKYCCERQRGVAQFGRVLGLGPRCRRFEPCHLDQKVVCRLEGLHTFCFLCGRRGPALQR